MTSLCQAFLCSLRGRGLGLDALLPLMIAHDPGHVSPPLGGVRSCLAGALCRLLGGPYPLPSDVAQLRVSERAESGLGRPDERSRKERTVWACFTEGLPSPSLRGRSSAQAGQRASGSPGLLTRGHPQGDKETGSRLQSGTAACPQAALARDSPQRTRVSHQPLLSLCFSGSKPWSAWTSRSKSRLLTLCHLCCPSLCPSLRLSLHPRCLWVPQAVLAPPCPPARPPPPSPHLCLAPLSSFVPSHGADAQVLRELSSDQAAATCPKQPAPPSFLRVFQSGWRWQGFCE